MHILHLHCWKDVAAEMSSGLAYILDEDDTLIPKVSSLKVFYKLCSLSLVLYFLNYVVVFNYFITIFYDSYND
jgi:hypothetical protein